MDGYGGAETCYMYSNYLRFVPGTVSYRNFTIAYPTVCYLVQAPYSGLRRIR